MGIQEFSAADLVPIDLHTVENLEDDNADEDEQPEDLEENEQPEHADEMNEAAERRRGRKRKEKEVPTNEKIFLKYYKKPE